MRTVEKRWETRTVIPPVCFPALRAAAAYVWRAQVQAVAIDLGTPEPGIVPDVIRRANIEDAGEILTVQRAAYLTEAQIYEDPFIPPLVESLPELMSEVASETVLVATVAYRLVGAVRLKVRQQTGHIERLVVAPDLQGNGIGTRLLRAAERAAPCHVTRFELFTGAASSSNLALYGHLGYLSVARRRLTDSIELVILERAR